MKCIPSERLEPKTEQLRLFDWVRHCGHVLTTDCDLNSDLSDLK